jgi:hypothetical protein
MALIGHKDSYRKRASAERFRRLLAQAPYEKCGVSSCTAKRRRLRKLCGKHERRKQRNGDEMATQLLAVGEYRRERREVRALFKLHAQTHIGIRTAAAFIDSVLARAEHGDDTLPGLNIWHRLATDKVPALEILEEACAVWLYQERNRFHFRSDNHFTVCLAAAVSRLAGLTKVTRYSDGVAKRTYKDDRGGRLVFGQFLRETLARLFVGVASAIMEQNLETRGGREALRADFTTEKDNV